MIRPLGHGAGGQTWLAERDHTLAPVAVKILAPRTSDDCSIRRAWRELEILQQIRLPNVPRLLDFGPYDASLYIATEYIEGVPLDQFFGLQIPDTFAQMHAPVELLASVARAVQQLHERGVIHRDLKPSNIVITSDGTPFVIDFGISSLQTDDHNMTLTSEGVPIGTPAYMPPEQARGERDAISIRSDIYALGAIGYWLLTGKTPHDLCGLTLHSAVHRIGWEPPRTPRTIRPDLPRPLAAVLAKACDADPARRYASALELAEDLDAWLNGKSVAAAPPSRWQRATRWLAHHPIVASTAGSLLIAGAILGSAAVTYRELTARPANLFADPTGSFVELVSRSGRRFHRWEGERNYSLTYQKLIPANAHAGTPDLAVIAMVFNDDPECVSRLRVYDVDDPGKPLWETPVTPPSIQMPVGTEAWERDGLPQRFQVRSVEIADVFDSQPGDEIIVCFNHTKKSPTCIRVYSMDGRRVLYEAWHNGHLRATTFVREQRLLVTFGVTDTHSISDLGATHASIVYPVIVLAINVPREPDPLDMSPRLVDSWAQAPTEDVRWTRVLDPVEVGEFSVEVVLRRSGDNHIQADVSRTHRDAGRPQVLHISMTSDGVLTNAWPDDICRAQFLPLTESLRLSSPADIDAGLVKLRSQLLPEEDTPQASEHP